MYSLFPFVHHHIIVPTRAGGTQPLTGRPVTAQLPPSVTAFVQHRAEQANTRSPRGSQQRSGTEKMGSTQKVLLGEHEGHDEGTKNTVRGGVSRFAARA